MKDLIKVVLDLCSFVTAGWTTWEKKFHEDIPRLVNELLLAKLSSFSAKTISYYVNCYRDNKMIAQKKELPKLKSLNIVVPVLLGLFTNLQPLEPTSATHHSHFSNQHESGLRVLPCSHLLFVHTIWEFYFTLIL